MTPRAASPIPSAVVALALVVALAGCGGDRGERGDATLSNPVSALRAPERGDAIVATPEAPPPPGAPIARKLVQHVTLTLVVADPESAATTAQRIAGDFGGFAQDVQVHRPDGQARAQLTLRIPAPALDSALTRLRALATRVETEGRNVEDVTAQYVDLDARLRTLAATETELLGLLRESRARGHKAEDIVAIYRELTSIRSQIEAIQGQLRLMDRLASLATVRLQLEPDVAAAPLATRHWSPFETVRGSLRQLVSALQGLVDFGIRFVIVVLPILVILALPIAFVVRRLLRRARTG